MLKTHELPIFNLEDTSKTIHEDFNKDAFITIAIVELNKYLDIRLKDPKYTVSHTVATVATAVTFAFWSPETSETFLTPEITETQIKKQALKVLIQRVRSEEIKKTFISKTDQVKLASFCETVLTLDEVEDFSSAQKCLSKIESIRKQSITYHNEEKHLEDCLGDIGMRTFEIIEVTRKKCEDAIQTVNELVNKIWTQNTQIKTLFSPEIKKQLNPNFIMMTPAEIQKQPIKQEYLSTNLENVESAPALNVGKQVDGDSQKKKGPPVAARIKVGETVVRKADDIKFLSRIVDLEEKITTQEKIKALGIVDPASYNQLYEQLTNQKLIKSTVDSASRNDAPVRSKRIFPMPPNSVASAQNDLAAPLKKLPPIPQSTSTQNDLAALPRNVLPPISPILKDSPIRQQPKTTSSPEGNPLKQSNHPAVKQLAEILRTSKP